MADPETSTTVVGTLASIIVFLLGKLGWDAHKKNQVSGDELNPESKPTRRDTILMLMTDRVHAVRNDLTPQLSKLQLEDAKMDLRITQNRDDINRLRVDLETGFKEINSHIEASTERIENSLKDSLNRIWQRLDSK